MTNIVEIKQVMRSDREKVKSICIYELEVTHLEQILDEVAYMK